MIDTRQIKEFWHARANAHRTMPQESAVNLEEDQKLLRMKLAMERRQILPRLDLKPDMTILDLGAGYGQWAFQFAPHVRKILAVEYAHSFVELGRKEAVQRGLDNVNFTIAAAECYIPSEPLDLIFISGLFIYMQDDAVGQVLDNILPALKPQGRIFLRDATSILPHRYELDNVYSPALKTKYSALYRTRNDYIELFKNKNVLLLDDGNMFEENCPLNKFPETRLRFYIFAKYDNI